MSFVIRCCATAVMLAGFCSAQAQVLWNTTLNSAETALPLNRLAVVSGESGAVVSSSYAPTSELARVRVVKTSAAGQVTWVRWVDGSPLVRGASLFAHPDASISQVVERNGQLCVVNFTGNGVSRANYCVAGSIAANVATTQTPDGSLIIGSGYSERRVTKFAANGVAIWSASNRSNSSNYVIGSGLDSSANYYELAGGTLTTRRTSDGALLSNATLAETSNIYLNDGQTRRVVARSNGDVVVITSVTYTSNAVLTQVNRYAADGAKRWQRTLTFPVSQGYSSDAVVLAEGTDDVIVARVGQSSDSGSELARLDAQGAIVWQRHLSRIAFILPYSQGLKAIRTDFDVNASNSYIFPLASSDGSLGTPIIYSRNDPYAANSWFALDDAIVAAFQSTGGIPSASYAEELASTMVYLPQTNAQRWLTQAKAVPNARISQGSCLMPRLAQSNPATWWSRVERNQFNGFQNWLTNWFGRGAADGTGTAQTPEPASNCGYPLTDDGGQVVISQGLFPRAKKLSAEGNLVWQVQGDLSPTQYGGSESIQASNSIGDTVYAFGNLVGRVSALGVRAFETLTGRTGPRYLALDTAGNSVVAYNDSAPAVVKISPSGTILWTRVLDVPGCDDRLGAVRQLANGETLVMTQSCGEGRLYRLATNGSVLWQRIVSGTASRPYVQLGTLAEDATGNLFAGGCIGKQQSAPDTASQSLLVSWSASGSERWSAQADLAGATSDCVSSIGVNSDGLVFATVSTGDANAPLLWSLSATGEERWTHRDAMSNPAANDAEGMIDESGNFVVLGQSFHDEFGGVRVSLRKIDASAIGSPLRVKFLEVPTSATGARVPFSIRIGLRTQADQPSSSASAQIVRIGVFTGDGQLSGNVQCEIAIGASECTIADVLYDLVESGVSLAAWVDGSARAVSPSLSFVRASTATSLAIDATGALTAFDVQTLIARVTSPAAKTSGTPGYLDGPSPALGDGIRNCNGGEPGVFSVLERRCDFLVRTVSFPITARFVAFADHLEGSEATLQSPLIGKAQPVISVAADPSNTMIGGDRLRFRVMLQTPSNFNLVPYVPRAQLIVSNGNCISTVQPSTYTFNQVGSYYVCEVLGLPIGTHSVTFSFAGNDDLLPAQSVSQNATLVAGGVIRGTSRPWNAVACSPTPGVSCSSTGANQGEWRCTGPEGMSGQVFFVPDNGQPYTYADTPIAFSNVTGLQSYTRTVGATYESTQCRLDVDGDGAKLSFTDGVIILRRMLQLSGDALVAGATHSCVPLAPAGIASRIELSAYDFDGDGRTDAATDGLMLLRVLIGFRGDAVIANAIGPNATLTTWNDVSAAFSTRCGLYLN